MKKKNVPPSVIVAGTIALDDVRTPFGAVKRALGGSATFAALGCALFEKPGIASVVGNDFPAEHIQLFQQKGIDTQGIEIRKLEKTFHWKGEYGMDLNNAKTIRTDLNVVENFDLQLPTLYREAPFLFLGNLDPEIQLNIIKQMKQRPKIVIADSMNLWISTKREKVLDVIQNVDLFLLNEIEARQLFNISSLKKAANELLKLGLKNAIIKKGEHGCISFTKDTHFACPGYPLENIMDPTRSGDSFGGSLLGYLSKTEDFSEKNMRKAIVFASCVASYNAEGFSVNRLKTIGVKEIRQRYNEFQKIAKF